MPDGSPLAVYTGSGRCLQKQRLAAKSMFALRCAMAIRRLRPRAGGDEGRWLRVASCSRRSIRNIRARPRRLWSMRPFAGWPDMRWQPALRTLPAYYDDPAIFAALAATLECGTGKARFRTRRHCRQLPRHARTHVASGRSLSLPVPENRAACCPKLWAPLWSPSSRASVGPNGLSRRPKTRSNDWRREGKKKIAIFAPGFSADCLETLEELAMQGKEQFEEAGGERLCLSAVPECRRRAWTCSKRSSGGNFPAGCE
jgi:hypothetical protein